MKCIPKEREEFKAYARPQRITAKNKQNNAAKWARFRSVGCATAKSILLVLANALTARGVATLSHSAIAEMADCSIVTVRRKLVQLEAAGYLTRQRRHNRKGHRAADCYILSTHRDDLGRIKPLKRVAKIKPPSAPVLMNLTIPQCASPNAPLGIEHLIDRPVKGFPGKVRSTLPFLPSFIPAQPPSFSPFRVPSRLGGMR